jgi:glutathione peroxidase-family protein
MRRLAFVALQFAALSTLATTLFGEAPVPHKSAEFIVTEPSGKQIPLSSFKGKVVVLTFMYTTCPHCQREAQMVTKLQHDYAAKGFQALGAAFNFEDKDAPAVRSATVSKFISDFGVGYPVGYSSPINVQNYLGLSVMDRYVVPQIAVIDRKGNVVKQSNPTTGSEELQTEASLRALVEKLLKEGTTTSSNTSSSAPAAKVAKTN